MSKESANFTEPYISFRQRDSSDLESPTNNIETSEDEKNQSFSRYLDQLQE